MTRCTLVSSVAAADGPILIAISLFVVIGCNETYAPQIQTISEADGSIAEVVQPATPEERKEAMDRLDRAIKAHGGSERLRTKLKTVVQRMNGHMFSPDEGMVPIEQELKSQLPDRLRLWTKSFRALGIEEGTITLSGNAAWFNLGGLSRPLGANERGDLDQEVVFRRTLNLLVLKENEYLVRPVAGVPLNGQPTVGIVVGSKQLPATRYYFDAKSNLLVRTFCRSWPEANDRQSREIHFSGYKDFDGLMLPTKYTDKRNGRVAITLTINYSFPSDLDAKEFTPQ
jgi:hypothetical protein